MKSGDLLVFNRRKRFVSVYRSKPDITTTRGKVMLGAHLAVALIIEPMHSFVLLTGNGDIRMRWVETQDLTEA